jgi:membrane-bound serine protease (ClpP class)
MTQAAIIGIILIFIALVLLLVEIKTPGFGVSGLLGTIALVGGLLLIFGISAATLPYIIAGALLFIGFFAVLFFLARKAQSNRVVTGEAGMIGLEGRAETSLLPKGKVLVRGELWDAWSAMPIKKGEPIKVVKVQGLRLEVINADPNRIPGRPLSALPSDVDDQNIA